MRTLPRLPRSALLVLAFLTGPVAADPRADFLAAERALDRGDTAAYAPLLPGLAGYPLTPYLEYRSLTARLSLATPAQVQALEARLADSPLGDDLGRAWLTELARRGEWDAVRSAYRPGLGVASDCLHARAALLTGARAQADAAARTLWLHGASRPSVCDALFEDWAGTGALTPALAWQRFGLAMDAGQHGLARHLVARLAPPESDIAQRWLAAHAQPGNLEAPGALGGLGAHAGRIVTDVMRAQARSNPLDAAARWERLRNVCGATPDQAARVDRALAVMLAVDREALAGQYFARVPAAAYDDATHEWRVRHSLAQSDWDGVRTAVQALPPALAAKSRWQYWRARACAALGDAACADAAYRAAARERDFHGFLAAETVGLPVPLNARTTDDDSAAQERLAARAPVMRARELFALDRAAAARREWYFALRDAKGDEVVQAARLAHRWGWHADAITLATRAGLWDDLDLRFPVVHDAEVATAAQASGLDPALIRAVMRRESALNPRARSHADARGLMQLLPDTARRVAREMGVAYSTDALYDERTNIRFGSQYLADQLARFGGHRALAAAAYNAGPHRVERWLGATAQPADVWIELIPFGETREYVSAVLAYAAIYQARTGGGPAVLRAWLPPVPARDGLVSTGASPPS